MPGARRIFFHPDPERLEDELAARIREVKSEAGPWARVLVTVPTQRQALRLRERLAERERALLGVEILQYQALAYRRLESSASAPSILSEPVLERLIDRLLAQHPQFALTAYARERPGVLAELRARLLELREAGVRPQDLTPPRVHPSAQTSLFSDFDEAGPQDGILGELSVILDAFDRAVVALESRGWTDRPGLAHRAGSRRGLEFEAVFAYGAYEIVGVHLQLLQAIRASRPLTFFVPADLESPAWRYARDQAARFFGGTLNALPDPVSAGPFVTAARCMFRSDASPPTSLPAITLAHAQGPEAELTLVARRVLALIAEGVPARDIAIVARSLEPYLALAETVFARHRLPVDASASLPLARHPEPRTVLLLLRALSEDFDRRTISELVRSPYLQRPEWGTGTPLWRPVPWERWSRTYGLTSGVEAWTVELPRLLRERSVPPWMQDPAEIAAFPERRENEAQSAEMLGRLVSELAAIKNEWGNCKRADEHVAFLETLRGTWIRPQKANPSESAALDRVWDLALEQIRSLEAVLDPEPLDRDTVLNFVEDMLEAATFADPVEDGVSFLDMRQARGLGFRHVFFIGLNDGLYPRPPRETPLLPDRARQDIRDRTGKPLAIRREGRAEEQLLLAALVASTRESLTVSWQRADAEGRALAPSMALRELCALLPGAPTLSALLKDIAGAGLPTEPTLSAAWLERETGLLLREEAALLSARNARSAVSGVRRFLDQVEPELDLSPGLALIEATESGDGLAYDGAILPLASWSRPYSSSSLEQLARCPLTFFFRHILDARPLDQEAREYRTEVREVGQVVHRILEAVYRDLDDSGLMNGHTDAEALVAAGHAALGRQWEPGLSTLAWRMNRRYPLLYATTSRIWKEEIETFLERDLTRLAEGGHTLESLETAWNARLSSGLSITGVPDRVTKDSEGRFWISDYKTSGKLDKHTDPLRYLRGEHVQLPIYVLMGMSRQGAPEPRPEAEIVGLGPNFFPDFGFIGSGPNRFEVERFEMLEAGFLETLSVLSHLVETGRFPFRTDRHCRWCQFNLACRRHQLSSETRVLEHPDHERYFRLRKKTTQKPLLDGAP